MTGIQQIMGCNVGPYLIRDDYDLVHSHFFCETIKGVLHPIA